ncbi:glycerol kinase [Catalinimonas alkaloidigena]|uniref:Glycerol kinase n=1 Tax=Catalinimonas alkaloidigena TaxID=1075417 RepID=A0A1G8X7D3_9BACT|nr:glycerol kinase GlpK [Catalinimonas alkaloidigena]SDJ86599.1 glycerol kinase [Catalinimonas alkaloidigena]
MTPSYVLALDQGTTSSRAVLFDHQGRLCRIAQQEFTQHYPKPGWVEHDANEIWTTQKQVTEQVLRDHGVSARQVVAIGITNQRETTVIWDRTTGEPIANALVWQDKRTAPLCEELRERGLEDQVREKTGLVIDSYFSATKIRWMLDHIDRARERAERGELLFGTMDTWLMWKATGGQRHVTDYTNAGRTMLFDIRELAWDEELLRELDIPAAMLPDVLPCSADFGTWTIDGVDIPIAGVAGDQHAALFGQACFEPGTAKNTYGTGCFMLMNTGEELCYSKNGLISTLAWGPDGKVNYALEGSIFIAGAAVQWLRDGLKLIQSASETEALARQAGEAQEVYVVPAFVGLGAPYWDMYARGAIFGLTRDTGAPELVRATLQSLAYQTRDVLEAMQEDSGLTLQTLKVDGGAVANNYLMQFQADILGVEVERPEVIESTAWGAACLAGMHVGIWSLETIAEVRRVEKRFAPHMDDTARASLYAGWQKAVKRTLGWLHE